MQNRISFWCMNNYAVFRRFWRYNPRQDPIIYRLIDAVLIEFFPWSFLVLKSKHLPNNRVESVSSYITFFLFFGGYKEILKIHAFWLLNCILIHASPEDCWWIKSFTVYLHTIKYFIDFIYGYTTHLKLKLVHMKINKFIYKVCNN